MITTEDIEFMKESLDDIYTNRQRQITLIYEVETVDEISGLPIGRETVEEDVIAVVTEMSIRRGDGARTMESGIVYEEGDIKIDVKKALVGDIIEDIYEVVYEGKRYEILGKDRKGIGIRNRYEMLGRGIA